MNGKQDFVTSSLEADYIYPAYTTNIGVILKVETSSAHILSVDFSVQLETSHVQHIYIFINCGFFNEGEGVHVILRLNCTKINSKLFERKTVLQLAAQGYFSRY